jgi:uncharacterized protein YoaH (UPF0181 family)
MSRKSTILSIVTLLVLINGVVVAGLYFLGYIFQPSPEDIAAEKLALEEQQKAAEDVIKYAHLEPLPEFKSRVGYVVSMGEAVAICEKTLQEKEKARKSWAVNHIESRYLPHIEQYKIFLDYVTIPPANEEPKSMKVICEVEEATKQVSNWKPMKS